MRQSKPDHALKMDDTERISTEYSMLFLYSL